MMRFSVLDFAYPRAILIIFFLFFTFFFFLLFLFLFDTAYSLELE